MKQSVSLLMIFQLLFVGILSLAQDYEPTILILSPNITKAEQVFEKEINEYNKMVKQMQMNQKEIDMYLDDVKHEPENIQFMTQKQIEFVKHASFYHSIPMISESYLQYRFYERFENLLIYAINETSDGSKQRLNELATSYNMQYVLNFLEVNSYMKNGSAESTIRVQLFDNRKQSMLIDKEYIGDATNPGFEFACEEGINCTFSNALAQALHEVIQVVAENNPTLSNERKLAEKRMKLLLEEYFDKKPNSEIASIIELNSDIEVRGYYQGFMSEDKTKFIGFFALDNEAEGIKDMKERGDKNINVFTDDFFDGVPRIYAFVVVGVLYNSKWYMKKQEVTYFDAEDLEQGKKLYFTNLMKWGFFEEGGTAYDTEFWERHFFERVKDVTKEPDYEQYRDMYEDDARENKDYIGLYELVADGLKNERTERFELVEETTKEKILLPFLNKKIEDGVFDNFYLSGDKFILIYPTNQSVLLCPINIEENGKEVLKYFLITPEGEKIYEWVYLKQKRLKDAHHYYGSEVISQLSKLVDWHFGFESLDDESFWKNYVLAKKNGKFKYLIPVN